MTAELDPKLAGAAAEIFVDDPQVEVLAADWSTLRGQGAVLAALPRRGEPPTSGVDAVADLVERGRDRGARRLRAVRGVAAGLHGRVDTLREEWLTDERFTTVEVMVASDAATLIATRR